MSIGGSMAPERTRPMIPLGGVLLGLFGGKRHISISERPNPAISLKERQLPQPRRRVYLGMQPA
jgi:hypothetical protein